MDSQADRRKFGRYRIYDVCGEVIVGRGTVTKRRRRKYPLKKSPSFEVQQAELLEQHGLSKEEAEDLASTFFKMCFKHIFFLCLFSFCV
jgi:hypothetical protein